MRIKIKYHSDIERIEKITKGDWIDLRAAEDVFIPIGGFKLISLGVSMKLPEGCEAIIAPRSSTFKRYGIIMTNSIGIIDNSYSGTNDVWQFPALCLHGNMICNGQHGMIIHKNDRICQFRLLRNQDAIDFVEVDELDDTDRNGFGSTGR